MIVFFPVHKITKINIKKKRYNRFHCCFRNRAFPRCLDILSIKNNKIHQHARLKLRGKQKTRKEELVYASTKSTKSSIILKDSLIICYANIC